MKKITFKVSKLLLLTILGISISTIIFANTRMFYTPSKPGTPEIDNFGPTYVSLNWTTPHDNGGFPITNYRIEKRDKIFGKWEPNFKDAPVCNGCVFGGLNEDTEYQFRVKAKNGLGYGEPSDPSDAIITQ